MFFQKSKITGILNDHSIWSGHINELPPSNHVILLAGITDHDDHPLLSLRNGLSVEHFVISPDYQVVICHQGMEAFAPEERNSRSSHKKSQAIYLLKGSSDAKNSSLLVHFLPPESRTSCHFHLKTTEDFFTLAGSCFIGLIDLSVARAECQKHRLSVAHLRVPPLHVHQMWTEKEPALSFLIMRGLAVPTDMSDHYYFESLFLK